MARLKLATGNNTNNFCEAAMSILKDKILCRLKAFNSNQLVDFILTRLEHYYERRLIDVANNSGRAALQARFYPKEDIDSQSIVRATKYAICYCLVIIDNLLKEDDLYHVASASTAGTSYTVDMTLGLCTCQVGNTGGPCRHQSAVVRGFGVTSYNFLAVTSTPDATLHNCNW